MQFSSCDPLVLLILMNDYGNLAFVLAHIYTSVKQ